MAGRQNFHTEEQWMVRSLGRITGPYTTSEIAMALKSRRVTPMDEVNEAFGRWKLLRDEVIFLEIIKVLKQNNHTATEHTMTSTQTLASTVSEFRDMTKTKTIESSGVDFEKTVSGIKGKQSDSFFGGEKVTVSRTSSYGARDDRQFQNRAKRSMRTNWFGIFLFAAIVAGGFWYVGQKNESTIKPETFQEIYNRAVTYKSQGRYKEAIAQFSRAKELNKLDKRVDLEMAPLLIAIDSQTVVGRRLIEKIMGQSDSRDDAAEAYNAIGLSYLLDGDLRSAEEIFVKALSIDSNNIPLEFNRAVLEYKNGNFQIAEEHFRKLISKGSQTAETLIGGALSTIEVLRLGKISKQSYNSIVADLETYLKKEVRWRQQIQLILAFAYVRQSQFDKASQVVISLLGEDQLSFKDYSIDYQLDQSFLDWKTLMPYCDLLASSLPQGASPKALWGYCQFRSGEVDAAQQSIAQAEQEDPKSKLVQYLRAVIYHSVGQDLEAKSSLQSALDRGQPGSYLLKAAICETENDLICADEFYRKSIALNPKALFAYAGIARLAIKKGDKRSAADFILKGQNLSKSYVPLWTLQERI